MFIHQVPNIDISIKNGLIDQLQHEHINYFNPENALPLLNNQAFTKGGYKLSDEGNEMAIWGYYDLQKNIGWPSYRYSKEKEKIESYKNLINKKQNILLILVMK